MRPNYFVLVGRFGLAGVALVGQSAASRVFAQSVPTNWSGPYVGASAGVGTGHSTQSDSYRPPVMNTHTSPPTAKAPPGGGGEGGLGDGSYGLFGAMGGGIVGFNYQFDRYVVGIEGAIYGSTINGSSGNCGGTTTVAHQCGTRIDAEGDIRGRVGYSLGRVLPYVTGGVAFQDIHAYDSLFGVGGSGWKTGAVFGGGLEYKLTPQLSLRVEYLHTEIGSKVLYNITPRFPESVSGRTDSVRVGVSFGFGVPGNAVVAKY